MKAHPCVNTSWKGSAKAENFESRPYKEHSKIHLIQQFGLNTLNILRVTQISTKTTSVQTFLTQNIHSKLWWEKRMLWWKETLKQVYIIRVTWWEQFVGDSSTAFILAGKRRWDSVFNPFWFSLFGCYEYKRIKTCSHSTSWQSKL